MLLRHACLPIPPHPRTKQSYQIQPLYTRGSRTYGACAIIEVTMSKVSEYLNEHLQGEVTNNSNVRRRFSTDGSVLTITPEMVVFPRSTSDIRKVARFSWQLSEKGHKLPITPRGGGSDQTGGAIGDGIIIDLQAHMNTIFEVDPKQRLVRVQPGITFKALNEALKLHGLYIPSFPGSQAYSTLGGAIANNASGILSGKYGSTSAWVHQLEIVLSNGDVIQTGRLNKREVARKKGLQTFEGEIYRNIDNLIVDNDELLDSLVVDVRDNVGYNLVDVKYRNGSIDLAPLFIGSQGTLGIISEVIMKAAPLPQKPLVGAIAFTSYESARDGLDVLKQFGPSVLEYIDGRLFEIATAQGNRYQFYSDAMDQVGSITAVVYMEFDDKSSRIKRKIGKKIAKHFEQTDAYLVFESDDDKTEILRELLLVPAVVQFSDQKNIYAPGFLNGAFIPAERFEEFSKELAEIEKKRHIELPLLGHAFQDVYHAYPSLDFNKASDRQKILTLLEDWSLAVAEHGGHLIGEAAEGRLKAPYAYGVLDDEVNNLYQSVRDIFDPQGIMNTGVKQNTDRKQLIAWLRSEYDGSEFARFGAPS